VAAKSSRTKKRKQPAKSRKVSRKGGRRKPSKAVRRRRWGRLLALLFLFSLAGGIYLLYLDHTVRVKFEGKRWAIPARIFGRPLELYPGAAVTPKQLVAELQRLGYRRVRQADMEATWSYNAARYRVRTRSFRFWDGEQPSRDLDIRFSGNRLQALKDGAGRDLALAQLEAPEIGSIYPSHNEDRVLVKRDELPEVLVQALIGTEDRSFYEHYGVSPRAIVRALWANIKARDVVQGGSTLTQQLVKNFYLNHERTLWRKTNEALMALMLDAHYEKDAILEAYANEIYLGQDGLRAIHGFGLASHFYFNRPLKELDLPKLALLVALVRGPSYYDPRRNPERARERRDLVLRVLQEQGHITEEQQLVASRAPLGVTGKERRSTGNYPALLDLVRRQLHRDYREEDITSEGLRIFTTLDPWVQDQAERAVSQRLDKLEKQYRLPAGELEGAAVVVGSENGEILALVGGRNPRFAGFNRALDAVRPIGSLVKPAVYLTALGQPRRYSLVTPLEDAPLSIESPPGTIWTPSNYDNKSHGKVMLHDALTHSYNLATVRLGMDVGVEQVASTLSDLGVHRPVQPFPSLLLGAISLSPLEVAQVYQTLAAGGFRSPLRAIRTVQTDDGESLQRYPLTVKKAVSPETVYLINSNLQEVVRRGTGRGLNAFLSPDFNVAGKTGTTDDLRDSWFAGFTGDKVAVVWVGRDDNQPAKLTGASGALKVWGDMMRRLQPQPLSLVPPEEVEMVSIDSDSGLRGGGMCSDVRQYPFIIGSAPDEHAACAGGQFRNVFWDLFND
jgi:penicillin-binding protein 1B